MRLLLTLLTCVSLNAQPDERLVRLTDKLRPAADAMNLLPVVQQIWERDRRFTFPQFRRTSEYLAGEMTRRGLHEVQVIGAPADGKTAYGFWTMPLAWDVRKASLTLSDGTVLADWDKEPTSLGMWSGPTPTQGVETGIVWLRDAKPAAILAQDLRGKLVLTDVNPGGIKHLLAKQGALGAINAFTENRALRNNRQWINAWGDKGWGFLKGDTPLLCFSITPAQADALKAKLAAGPVRARVVVDSRLYEGEYPYVTGVLRGADPAEEVLTLGHIAEQGAHDNATGVAAMLGALTVLHTLIEKGDLPRPRRSIRMLAMGELYGTMHFLATQRKKNIVAAMTLDTPAAPYELPGTEYTFYVNPHVSSSFTDALILTAAEAHLSRLSPPRPFHWKDFMPGTDSFLGEPMIGIPTVWPYSGTGVHTHHNSADRPETVDARSLRDLVVITASYLYTVASAGQADAAWLASLSAARGEEQLRQAATVDWQKVPLAQFGSRLQEADALIRYRRDRAIQAVRSSIALGGGNVEASVTRVERAARDAQAGLQRSADMAVAMLGGTAPVKMAAPALNPEAAKIIVRRKRMGSMTLDDLPQDKWEGWPSGAWGTQQQVALFWCDGKRNLAEVMELTRMEAGHSNFDFVGYFRFLEKHGYVEFAK